MSHNDKLAIIAEEAKCMLEASMDIIFDTLAQKYTIYSGDISIADSLQLDQSIDDISQIIVRWYDTNHLPFDQRGEE